MSLAGGHRQHIRAGMSGAIDESTMPEFEADQRPELVAVIDAATLMRVDERADGDRVEVAAIPAGSPG